MQRLAHTKDMAIDSVDVLTPDEVRNTDHEVTLRTEADSISAK